MSSTSPASASRVAPLLPLLSSPSLEKNGASSMAVSDFLDVCRAILPVVDNLGVAFAIVRSDVGGNIDRVAARLSSSGDVLTIEGFLEACIKDGDIRNNSGPTKALLWLTRANLFLVLMLENAARAEAMWRDAGAAEAAEAAAQASVGEVCTTVGECANAAYASTLKPYHGFLASSAFSVALLAVPSAKGFVGAMLGGDDNTATLQKDLSDFASKWRQVLESVKAKLEEKDCWFEDVV